MIERIKKYKRWKDYFAVGCFEVNMAIGVTAILGVVLFKMFGIYEAFYNIQDDLKQILLSILGGEFTLLGMSLAGMAIITSVISTELIRIINLVDENETVNRVLSHFEFSAFTRIGIMSRWYLTALTTKLFCHSKSLTTPLTLRLTIPAGKVMT